MKSKYIALLFLTASFAACCTLGLSACRSGVSVGRVQGSYTSGAQTVSTEADKVVIPPEAAQPGQP